MSSEPQTATPPPVLSWRSIWIIAACGFAVFCIGLGHSRVLTRHEVLAAEPAREMLHDGHWIIPTFAGVPRLVKPPTMGWTIAGFMAVFGESEFVVRLPSALAGIAMALLVASMTARWFDDFTGLVAGLCQLTTFYMVLQARLAEADIPMAMCVTAAFALFARSCVGAFSPLPLGEGQGEGVSDDERRNSSNHAPSPQPSPEGRGGKALAALFYVFAGLAFLYKGGVVFVALGVVSYLIWQRDRRDIDWLASIPGIPLLLILLSAWPIAAYLQQPDILHVWHTETLGRASGEMGSPQPWHFYLWTIPWIILPWTPFTILGAIELHKRRLLTTHPIGRFLICWFVPGVILLSLSSWKHKHYVIPMLPALTPMTAIGMVAVLKSDRRLIGTIFGVATAIIVVINLFVLPRFDGYRPSADLARIASEQAPPSETIYLIGLDEAHAAYYLRFPIARIDQLPVPASLDRLIGLAPLSLVPQLAEEGDVEVIEKSTRGGRSERDADALMFIRWSRSPGKSSPATARSAVEASGSQTLPTTDPSSRPADRRADDRIRP